MDIDSRSPWLFLVLILSVGLSIALFFICWFRVLHPSITVLTSAIGTSIAAIVPTFAVIWINIFSSESRMNSLELKKKIRTGHYKQIDSGFFANSFFNVTAGKILGNVVASPIDFLRIDQFFDRDLIDNSLRKTEGLQHIDEEFGTEIKNYFLDSEKLVEQHNLKCIEFDKKLKNKIEYICGIKGYRLKPQDKFHAESGPFFVSQFLISAISNIWQRKLYTAKYRSIPIDFTLDVSARGTDPFITIENQDVGKSAGNHERWQKTTEALISDLIRDDSLTNELQLLFDGKQSMDEKISDINTKLNSVSARIKNDVYTITTNCCPYQKAKLWIY